MKSIKCVYPLSIYTLNHMEIVKENIFQPLISQFFTFKVSLISFLLDRPKNTRSNSPSLNTPFIYKRVMPPQANLPNRLRYNPPSTKNGEYQLPLNFSPCHNEGGYGQWTLTHLYTMHSYWPTSTLFFKADPKSIPFPSKPPK